MFAILEGFHRGNFAAYGASALASRGFHEDITVRAMNSVEEWGASDHCRLLIKIGDRATPAVNS